MGVLSRLTSIFKRKSNKNTYQIIAENPDEPLKSIVKFNNSYMMWMGTAEANKHNMMPVEEWFVDHFRFMDSEGKFYFDVSAGLKYSSNVRFKFCPQSLVHDHNLAQVDTPQKEPEEQKLLEYHPN